jgi:acyl carrier protein
MADDPTIEDRIRHIIVECLELGLAPEELQAEADLKDDVGLDSAALLDLVAGIEEAFGFEVDVEDVTEDNFRSVAGLARFVRTQAGGRESPAC